MTLSLEDTMKGTVAELRRTFESGLTLPYKWRLGQLKALEAMVKSHKKEILEAIYKDLRKPEAEADMTELAVAEQEVRDSLVNLHKWMQPEEVPTPAWLVPAKCELRRDPYGVVLSISPFNYPFQLAFVPIMNALAAGNCVLLKPSELTPHVSALFARLIPAYLDTRAVQVVEGGIAETSALLAQRWDLVFFTGSEAVGKIVHQACARHLTPCVLELGGKSPVVVDKSVRDVQLAARRVVWGKFVNVGQTCIAPDYVLCHKDVYHAFLQAAKDEIRTMFSTDTSASPDLARIVSTRHAQRLADLLNDKSFKVEAGGEVNVPEKFIAPTLLSGVSLDSRVMEDEIFGPILPILQVNSTEEAVSIIRRKPQPLALYIFAHDRTICDDVMNQVPSGGVCLNDTLVHFACTTLPFGGIGTSGLGQYHGRFSFETFTHVRGVLSRWDHWLGDVPAMLRYAPYSPLKHKAFRLLTDAVAGVEFKTTLFTVNGTLNLVKALLMVLGVVYLVQQLGKEGTGWSGFLPSRGV